MNSTHITIDGVGPMSVERPATVADLCAIVRRGADSKTAIYPVGGGTMLDYGMPPARPGIALSTTALNQVIDYPARDLTITVQAGITMADLQATLAKENQWLPIDIPESATIGGAIACDVSGPRRYGYGTLRDYVIGITVVNDRGEETHAGGRVVKNVAGYDFMKLHTGALGTLGVITQVTLKVKPKPEAWETRIFPCGFDQLELALEIASRTITRPIRLGFRRVAYENKDSRIRWLVSAAFEGSGEATAWQDEQLVCEFESHGIPDWNGARGDGPQPAPEAGGPRFLSLRAHIPPSAASELCNQAFSIEKLHILASSAGAIVELGMDQADCTLERAASVLSQVLNSATSLGGEVSVERCPTAWKKALKIWGRPPADLALQKAVKRALDPQNLFNPGRFVTDAF